MKFAELGFNPANGNKMDLKVKPLPGDQARFELSPKLDLSLAFKLGAIAADFDEEPPAFLLNETYYAGADGRRAGGHRDRPRGDTFEGGFKMVAGSLRCPPPATRPGPRRRRSTCPMGQCLTGNDEAPDGAHPVIGQPAGGDLPLIP